MTSPSIRMTVFADARRQNFQIQLGPFVTESQARGNAVFSWTQGVRKAVPPPGFEDYFGAGPLWRFIDYDGHQGFDVLERIRDFPEGPNAEETMRLMLGEQPAYAMTSVKEAIQRLLDMIDADPEIEVFCAPALPRSLSPSPPLLEAIPIAAYRHLRASWDTPRARPPRPL